MQGATGYREVTKLEAVGMEWKIVICRKSIIQSFFISGRRAKYVCYLHENVGHCFISDAIIYIVLGLVLGQKKGQENFCFNKIFS